MSKDGDPNERQVGGRGREGKERKGREIGYCSTFIYIIKAQPHRVTKNKGRNDGVKLQERALRTGLSS